MSINNIIKKTGLVAMGLVFYILLVSHASAACRVEQSCTERQIMVCPESGGGYNRCVQYEPAYPGQSARRCLQYEWVERRGTCAADWETVCTSRQVCDPPPPPPVRVPPPRPAPRITPPVTPIPATPTPEPIPTCYEGSPDPACSPIIESDSCQERTMPVWIRILSLEDGQTISWMPGEDQVPNIGRFSVPPEEGGGLDSDGYFQKFRAFSYERFNGRNVFGELLHDFNGMSINSNHYDGRRDMRAAQIKTFDKSKNRKDPELKLSLKGDIVGKDDNAQYTVDLESVIRSGRNWSNHFCGGGRAIAAAEENGNITANGGFIGSTSSPAVSGVNMCDKSREDELMYCSFNRFGGEQINMCQDIIRQTLAENPPETEYDADEDPHKNRADDILDDQENCRMDFDGCVSGFLRGGDSSVDNLGLLNTLISRANDALPGYDIRYDEYWTLSYLGKLRQAGSEDGSTVQVTFDEEWTKEYFICQVDMQNYIRIDNVPDGYVCDDIKIIHDDGTVDDKNTTANEEFEYSPSERPDIVRTYPDGTCKAVFKPGEKMIIPILKRQDACNIDINPTVSCNATNTAATVNWTFEDHPTEPISNLRYNLNTDPLSSFTPMVGGDLQGNMPKTQTQVTLSVEQDKLYEVNIEGMTGTQTSCASETVSFVCEPPRQDLCVDSTIVENRMEEDFFRIRSEARQPVEEFMYIVYNRDNLDGNGNPRTVCIPYEDGGYVGDCPAGTMALTFRQFFDNKSNRSDLSMNYSQVFIPDLNNEGLAVERILIQTFFRDPGIDNGRYSAENENCNITLSTNQIPFNEVIPAPNFYTNMGKFRKVGEWKVDMQPPIVNRPRTSNYLYDSFDTDYSLRTDTAILDAKLGCYNLDPLSNFAVTFLGYLGDNRRYVNILDPIFSSANGSFPFLHRELAQDANGNNILNPLATLFPNCVDSGTIAALKQRVNQPVNLENGGSDVSFVTKHKISSPDNFEDYQNIYKATDLACNTNVSDPGDAGQVIPRGWISTDGGTVHYSYERSEANSPASSPLAPVNTQKIDSNLYCSYNYTAPDTSKIFYKDANTDNSILNIAKSVLANDGTGISWIGSKEDDYQPGDDLLLDLYGDSATHFSVLKNEVKSKTDTKIFDANSNPTVNSLAALGCDPAVDERCYIEVEGNLNIQGDDTVPTIQNNFCNNNALLFVNGDLTITDNLYRNNSIDSCCGFIVNGNINFAPSNPTVNGYNQRRYNEDYLARNDVDWYNTYECSTGFYYSEENITINPDQTNYSMLSSNVNTTDPMMLKGDLVAKGNITQSRTNGIGNLSRPAVYLSKDSCIVNNFPELTNALLKLRDRDMVVDQ